MVSLSTVYLYVNRNMCLVCRVCVCVSDVCRPSTGRLLLTVTSIASLPDRLCRHSIWTCHDRTHEMVTMVTTALAERQRNCVSVGGSVEEIFLFSINLGRLWAQPVSSWLHSGFKAASPVGRPLICWPECTMDGPNGQNVPQLSLCSRSWLRLCCEYISTATLHSYFWHFSTSDSICHLELTAAYDCSINLQEPCVPYIGRA